MRQSVTEFIYINSLAYHPIRSTIKTLPATLPEPRSQVQAPIIALLEPRNGVTDAVWQSALGLVGGVGVKRARSAARGPRFYDGLIETVEYNFIPILFFLGKLS